MYQGYLCAVAGQSINPFNPVPLPSFTPRQGNRAVPTKVKRFRSYVLYILILCKALVKVLHLFRATTVSQIQQWLPLFLFLTQKNNTPATIAMNHTSSKGYQYTVVNFKCDDAFELSLQLLLTQ